MASASDGDTPSAAAIEPTSEGLTVSAVGTAPPALEGVVDTISVVPLLVAGALAPAPCRGVPAGGSTGGVVDTISVVPLLVAGALTPAPCRVVPAMSRPEGFRPLAAASESTLTPS